MSFFRLEMATTAVYTKGCLKEEKEEKLYYYKEKIVIVEIKSTFLDYLLFGHSLFR